MLNDKTFRRTSSVECLGILLDKKLKLNGLIEKIFIKIEFGIAMLRKTRYFIPVCSRQIESSLIFITVIPYEILVANNCFINFRIQISKFQCGIIAGVTYDINHS